LGRLAGAEIRRFWRQDLTGLCLLILLGIVLRSVLFQNIRGAVVVSLLVEPLTVPIMLVLRRAFREVRLDHGLALRPVAVNVSLCIAAAIAQTAWAKIITNLSGWFVPTWGIVQTWVVPSGYYSIVFASWALAHFWIAAEIAARNEQQLAVAAKAEALRAELNHLRQQLDPHFLFNALNGIAAEIPEHPETAVGMVRELADYLRYSLDHRDLSMAPFSAEMEAVRSYLEVQKARFGPELRFRLSADDAARKQLTPSFLLHPLIENAVKHGLRAGVMPLDIAIAAVSDGASLRISVTSTGMLRTDWATAGDPGVGLSVLRRRLALHYPDRHEFDMRQTGDKVTAELKLRGEPCSA
jgi:hypothetical protein